MEVDPSWPRSLNLPHHPWADRQWADHLWADHLWADHQWADHLWADHRWADHRWADHRWADHRWVDPWAWERRPWVATVLEALPLANQRLGARKSLRWRGAGTQRSSFFTLCQTFGSTPFCCQVNPMGPGMGGPPQGAVPGGGMLGPQVCERLGQTAGPAVILLLLAWLKRRSRPVDSVALLKSARRRQDRVHSDENWCEERQRGRSSD